MTLLTSLLAFAVAIGVLVTVHEYGHYLAARAMGVKVLRFSVGFGRPLLSRRFGRDRTEFVVAALPLGGYVKMLDEREGEVAPEERDRAFNNKGLKARTFIVSAGPLANFLFAMVAYAAMFMIGVGGVRAVVGEVTPESPAAVPGWSAARRLSRSMGAPCRIGSRPICACLTMPFGVIRCRFSCATATAARWSVRWI